MTSLQPVAKFSSFNKAASYINHLSLGPEEAVVVVTRHGPTVFNKEHRLQAWVPDADRLTATGKEHASLLQNPLSQLPITWAASSDLYRAIQTAELALPGEPIEPLLCLRDFDSGDLGGLVYSGPNNPFKTAHPKIYRTFKEDRRNYSAPGGENYREFETRIREAFIQEVLQKSLGRVSFIVTHSSPVREILFCTELSGYNVNDIKLQTHNTGLTIIHFDAEGSPTLLLFNNIDHLQE